LADALPLVETEAPSNLSVTGEIARSYPNPNVDDVAYIDDFESAQEQLSLSTTRTTWKQTTQPASVDDSWGRGKILWHTPRELRSVDEIYNRQSKQGEGTLRTLRLVFNPDTSALKSWAGIMRGFYDRIDADRVQLFEIRAKVGQNTRGKLHIDVGNINEDLNGDGIANTEDANNNGVVEDYEDVGLDGKPDDIEDTLFNNPNSIDDTLNYNPYDPAGDNWYFLGEGKCPLPPDLCRQLNNKDNKLWQQDSIYYRWLNGTEGNRNDPGWLGIPDEETLTRKGQVRFNRYFSYIIDFDSLRAAGSEPTSWWRVEGSDRNDWWTYRIPIKDSLAYTIQSGDGIEPRWNEVSHVRVWFEAEPNQKEPDTVEIADWYFVQTNWQDSVVYGEQSDHSTNFVVASISEEDGTFKPPPGVQPYKDPNYNVTEAQRGLQLKFEDFDPHDTCLATKQLIAVEKYSGYRRLEMYVHGDVNPTLIDSVAFFFRVGRDSLNFYEQRRTIHPGWDERNYINIDFNEITALKDAAMRSKKNQTEWKDIDTWSDDSTYHVRGNPNINEVKYYAAGIVNLRNTAHISGELWLDELRVTEVRKDVGTAARLSVNGGVADLLSYTFSFTTPHAFFRGLSSATRGGSADNLGSGRTSTSVSYGGSLSFDRFLPPSWGARIPISLSQSQSTTTPLLRTNSDIVLPKDIQEAEKSLNKSYSLRVSESFNRKGKNPLFSLLLNRLNSSFNYSRSYQRNVNTPYSISESYSVPASFDLGVSKVPTLPIFFWLKPLPILKKASGAKLGLYPSTWKLSGTYSRNLSITEDILNKRTSSFNRDFSGKMDVTYNVFDNLKTRFGYSTYRDLSDLDRVSLAPKNFRLGLETRYSQSFDASYDPKFFGFVTTAFSFKSSYSDSYSKINETRTGSMSRSYGVNGSFDHIKFLQGGKKSPGGRKRFTGGKGKDQSQEAEGKPKDSRPFYDPPLAVLRFLTGWIKPVSYGYNKGFTASVPGMADRPSMKYRLGFLSEPNVPTVAQGRSSSSSEDMSYQLTSGFSFLGGVATDVKFSRSIGQDLKKQGKRYKNVSTAWPDLSIRIQRFQKLPLIQGLVNRFIDLFSPRTGYNRQTREQYDLDGGFLFSRSVTTSHSPLLSVSFNVSRSLSLSGTYTLSKDNDEKYNPADGSFQSETRSSRNSIAISTKYSFSAPSGIALPLFGKVKFKSTVSVTVDVSRSGNKSETRRPSEGWVLTDDKSDFQVSPDVSYAFSSQIRGGLRAVWQDSYDNFRNRNNHRRELSAWAEIRF
jgi:cell surface protein SprA